MYIGVPGFGYQGLTRASMVLEARATATKPFRILWKVFTTHHDFVMKHDPKIHFKSRRDIAN